MQRLWRLSSGSFHSGEDVENSCFSGANSNTIINNDCLQDTGATYKDNWYQT